MADSPHTIDPSVARIGNLRPVEAADRLNELRYFVECVYMAAGQLEHDASNALMFVLDYVSTELRKLAVEINPHADAEGDENE